MKKPFSANHEADMLNGLFEVVHTLLTELHPNTDVAPQFYLDSRFDKDLGLDSLARVELISRVENRFNLALPERSFAEAETLRDLLRVLHTAESPLTPLTETEFISSDLDESNGEAAQASTLLEVLDWHVTHHGDRHHIQIYQDQGNGEHVSYWELKQGACKVAAGLQQAGIEKSEPVVIMLPTGVDYFYSFFGILLAGGVPVPIYPPARPSQLEDHMRRHVHIINNCLARIIITESQAKSVSQLLKALVPDLQFIKSVDELMETEQDFLPSAIKRSDIAFIQYTSGSTGNPKGVVLTHGNLLSNIRAMGKAVNVGPTDVFVSWLPLYHDMGLIGAWLGSLYYAALFVVMSPMSFLARPERWLRAIQHYKGTLSASPNFGYEYCLHRLQTEQLQSLDLSSWRAAFNGAEAVSPQTIKKFSERFEQHGFNSHAMMPVYGLAESSVGLAFPPLNRGPLIDVIERKRFMQNGVANPIDPDTPNSLKFPSSGVPLQGHQIRIVDRANHELPERQEGRLQFKGPSSTSGYYRNPKKNQSLFVDDWLDSGDLAYMANGEVYITGRSKDIIIRAGRNIYPHELEEAVGSIPGIRKGRVAVFASSDNQTATERLIILAETRSDDENIKQQLQTSVNTLATDLIGSPADEVVLAPLNSVLKTSSGKIRRTANREAYENGNIGKSVSSVPMQIFRLSFLGLFAESKRVFRYANNWLFAAYAWGCYAVLAPIVWISASVLPVFSWRWSIMRKCSRLLAKLTRVSLHVNGMENLPSAEQPIILVANHSSLLDSYVLVSVLPNHFHFIAKQELSKHFVTRIPLKNIHTEFVDRYDTDKSVAVTKEFANLIQSGESLMFFAEGTFTRLPGLMPFHLGAFSIAAQTNVAVLPISIRGTRNILRSDSWFPRHGSIHVDIGEPIYPTEMAEQAKQDNWALALKLRDKSRAFILRHCGEADLLNQNVPLE